MGDITPLQSFLAGITMAGLVGGVLALFVRRSIVRLNRQDPDWFAKARLRMEQAANERQDEPRLRRREVELLERIAENQERMLELLQEYQGERHR